MPDRTVTMSTAMIPFPPGEGVGAADVLALAAHEEGEGAA